MSTVPEHNPDRFVLTEETISDLRWRALWRGLGQLGVVELRRVLNHMENGGAIVCDTFNYDEGQGLWCPLAIGLNVPELIRKHDDSRKMTNERAKRVITEVGKQSCPDFSLNPMSGIPGNMFREHRRRDVELACRLLVTQKADFAAGVP